MHVLKAIKLLNILLKVAVAFIDTKNVQELCEATTGSLHICVDLVGVIFV